MLRFMLGLALVFASVTLPAQQAIDWSGAWVSRGGDDVVVLRNVHTTPWGWDGFAQSLARSHTYQITIVQTGTHVIVTFPGGSNNMLTIPEFPFGAEPRTTVVDRGEWWTKHVSLARWAGASLELRSLTLTGWWRDAKPTEVEASSTQFEFRVVLAAGSDRRRLSLKAFLADEKGELQYVQQFSRTP